MNEPFNEREGTEEICRRETKPFCYECGGAHEPSGSRSDCLTFWKTRAVIASGLVEWARTLLANATPAKTLDEQHSKEWCEAFGKFFAESYDTSQSAVNLARDERFFTAISDWIKGGTYRAILHRHDDTFRAVD